MPQINLKLCDIKDKLPKKIIERFCRECFEDVTLYPINYSGLVSKIAERDKVKPENVLLVNGIDQAIDLVSRVFGKNTLIFTPTYFEFLDAPKRTGRNFETINCFDGKEFVLNYKKSDVENRSLIFLCNPNNPVGLLKKEQIVEVARKTKAVVAVDEAYIDFNGKTMAGEIENYPNILVFRSFSKGFSLAGLRIGYVVGESSLIEKIRARLGRGIYPVTSVSACATKIALEEEKHFKELIAKIKKRKNDFEEFLKSKGFNVINTHTNISLLKFNAKESADEFFKFLEKNNVAVNQGNGISTCGLDETFIRIAIGTEKQMENVKEIIKTYFGK